MATSDFRKIISRKYSVWNIGGKKIWMLWVVILVSLLSTGIGTFYVKQEIEVKVRQEFDIVSSEIKNKIEIRLHAQEQMLRSGSAFFENSVEVTREEWRTYVEHQKIEKNLPGIQGIGFSKIIPPAELQKHIQTIRREGFPDYTIKPVGEREVYTSIIFLEPFSGRNLRAFGYDMYTDPVRRRAMEVSRDYDRATLSGKVILVQETETEIQAGVLMYVPVYKNSLPIGSVEERRKAIIGWIYSPFRMKNLMNGILGGYSVVAGGQFRIEIFDDSLFHSDGLLFDSNAESPHSNKNSSIFEVNTIVTFNSHQWSVRISEYDSKTIKIDYSKAWIIGLGGLIVSTLLCILFLVLINSNSRAFALANVLTKELQESESRYHALVEWTPEATIVHRGGKLIYANPSAVKLIGAPSQSDLIGKSFIDFVHPDNREIMEKQVAKIFATSSVEPKVERKLIKFDGSVIEVELQGTLINYDGEPAIHVSIQDITERNRAVEELRVSQKFLSELIENNGALIYVKDREGRYELVNKKWETVTGLNRLEVIGRTEIELFPGSVGSDFRKHDLEVMKLGDVMETEEIFEDKSGKRFFISIKFPLRDKKNEIRGLCGLSNEITERKKVEMELKRSEERFRHISSTISDLSYSCTQDSSGKYFIDWMTGAAEQITGYTISEIQEMRCWGKLVLEDDIHLFQQNVSGLAPGSSGTCEIRIKKKNGEIVWINSFTECVHEPDHFDQTYLYGGLVDITERKRADELVLKNQEDFKALFDNAPVGYHEIDNEGRIVRMNQTELQMLGYSIDDVLGDYVWKLSADEELSRQAVKAKLSGNIIPSQSYERIFRRKDGVEVPVLIEERIQKSQNGTITGIRSTIQDITERKNTERALHQIQKMESIGTLAGGIAHDFNNLLVGILGQSDLALKKLPKDSPAVSNITKAISASERAADLTRQLLAYSGKGKFFIVDIDLNSLVRENVQLLEISIPKNAQLRYDLNVLSPHISGDVGQIQQVIMNLIINAGESLGSNQGSIMLRTDIIELSKKNNEYWKYTTAPLVPTSYAVVEVSDTGAGISEESLNRIFDPFFTTKFTGRGLGLAAVLGIIRGHNGGLHITSTVGKGTTFKIVLPLIENELSLEHTKAEVLKPENNNSKTILVIDDDPSVIELLNDILTHAEYHVITSLNPLEGIEVYRSLFQDIDLVILDYSMPGMDGKETFEELLKINGDVRVLLSSGYTEESTLAAFGAIRPSGFFQKPYKMQEILDEVALQIRKNSNG